MLCSKAWSAERGGGPAPGAALRSLSRLLARRIKEAIQYACKSFLDEAEGITAPGQVYAWIAPPHRSLGREVDLHHREFAVDPVEDGLGQISAEDPGPAEELIALEDDADLSMLVEEVSSSLSDRRREVLALYGAGYKRPQIAERLGLTERAVKRDLLEIMDQARAILARLAGGGCDRGEPLVMRFICGIASPDESEQARAHLSHCGRCELFSERLVAWREKAGAMLPAPVVEGASPGLLGRLGHASTERIAALKQQVLDGGAQVKQQVATTYRAVDPTPLAAARPRHLNRCEPAGASSSTRDPFDRVDLAAQVARLRRVAACAVPDGAAYPRWRCRSPTTLPRPSPRSSTRRS
jgi:hypothetical protein